MSLNKPFNANEIHGPDFGEMIMASQSKAKFVDWKEIRVFSVAKSGMYIAFRVGSKKIVQIVCHETDEHETPRFERMALSEDANPIEGWTTTMIWKYKHGKVSTVKELADGLRGFDDEEMKGWKISEDEEQYPLVKILTKKAIHELVLHCEKNSFVPPTREEAFGEVEEYKSMTMETLREWYERACLGLGGGGGGSGQKRKRDRSI